MHKTKKALLAGAFMLAACWPVAAHALLYVSSGGMVQFSNGGTYSLEYDTVRQLSSIGSSVDPYDVQATSSNPAVFQVGTLQFEGVAANFFATYGLGLGAVGSSNVTLTRVRRSDGAVLEQVSFTIQITPAPLVIRAASPSRGYGLPNPVLSAAYNGLRNGDTAAVAVTTPPTLTTTAAVGSGVGTYPITVSGASTTNPNYTIQSHVPGTLTVTPAPLTIAAGSASRVYGSPNPALAAIYGGLRNGDTEADALTTLPAVTTTAATSSGAGAYPVTVGGAVASANYTIRPYVAGILTVTRAPLTITADNAARNAGAANPAFNASYGGFVNGDTAASLTTSPTFTTTATPASPAGTYTIVASGAASPNYTIAYVAGTLVVAAAVAASVTAVPLGGPWMIAVLAALLGFMAWRGRWRAGPRRS